MTSKNGSRRKVGDELDNRLTENLSRDKRRQLNKITNDNDERNQDPLNCAQDLKMLSNICKSIGDT